MPRVDVSPLPSDEEMAAISGACSLYLAQIGDKAGDNHGDTVGKWDAYPRLIAAKKLRLAGKSQNWSLVHRLNWR